MVTIPFAMVLAIVGSVSSTKRSLGEVILISAERYAREIDGHQVNFKVYFTVNFKPSSSVHLSPRVSACTATRAGVVYLPPRV
jgi:hypothetical protein